MRTMIEVRLPRKVNWWLVVGHQVDYQERPRGSWLSWGLQVRRPLYFVCRYQLLRIQNVAVPKQ